LGASAIDAVVVGSAVAADEILVDVETTSERFGETGGSKVVRGSQHLLVEVDAVAVKAGLAVSTQVVGLLTLDADAELVNHAVLDEVEAEDSRTVEGLVGVAFLALPYLVVKCQATAARD